MAIEGLSSKTFWYSAEANSHAHLGESHVPSGQQESVPQCGRAG